MTAVASAHEGRFNDSWIQHQGHAAHMIKVYRFPSCRSRADSSKQSSWEDTHSVASNNDGV